MYETEINGKVERDFEIPSDVLTALADLKGKIVARTVLPWSEHCTECVWPTCYSTCDLYVPREDGRCRRFADGMVRVDCRSAVNSYLLKIKFKRWAKLWTPGNVRLYPIAQAEKHERRDYRIGALLYNLPLPATTKQRVTAKRYSFKKRMACRPAGGHELPTCFLFECYNPENRTVRISLIMRPVDEQVKMPFQKLIELTPGFHRVRVPIEQVTGILDVHRLFHVELIPDDVENEITTLYFGLTEFVQEVAVPTEKVIKLKCVIWDLDNTIWEGTLIEDGAAKLQLKAGIREIIQALDERGILHSVASKNSHDEAMQVIQGFQLQDYFLYPQISWLPKSESVKAIVQQLNIGMDSCMFVDDSEFELAQVKAACPEVRILNARDYGQLPDMEECQAPVTSENKDRRKMYQMEAKRHRTAETFGDDYMAFLYHCQIELSIRRMTGDNIERVHELTQRTNQMNFSGNRYDRDLLKSILQTRCLDTYVLSCQDRFGSYGVVGFSIVDNREPRMTDLMFSCRIQSKRVEHAFLAHIVRKYIADSGRDFWANYRKTPRNAPSGRVFVDLGMEETGVKDGVTSLVFPKDRSVPDDGVIRIVEQEEAASLV